jgi:hypothetical protein
MEVYEDFDRFNGLSEAELLAWQRRLLHNNVRNPVRTHRTTAKRTIDSELRLDSLRPSDSA